MAEGRGVMPQTPEELEEEQNEPQAVSSSMVSEVSYDPEAGEMEVVFQNGKSYSYAVDRSVYAALLSAPSVGRFLWDEGLLSG